MEKQNQTVSEIDLTTPLTEETLRSFNFNFDELKLFREKLHWRVRSIIRDDVVLVHSGEGAEILPPTNQHRIDFKTESAGESLRVIYRGQVVYRENNNHIILGKWIVELQGWARAARDAVTSKAETDRQNEYEKLIAEMAGIVTTS